MTIAAGIKVLIPLKSGLVLDRKWRDPNLGIVLIPLKSGLVLDNRPGGGFNRRAVLIPLKSGLVLDAYRQHVARQKIVLIPLKSGLVLDRGGEISIVGQRVARALMD